MKAEIISIGTEITTGSILNTNTKYLSTKLLENGIEVSYHTSVEDNADMIKEVFKIALKRVDLIITTGGLGPTDDDLTKEIIAETLGLKLIKDKEMEDNIKNMFNSLNRPMPTNNKKQALVPEGGRFIANEVGTAPGVYISKDNKKIIMLPRPPKEMKIMFEKYVRPIIMQDFFIITKSINTIGIGESALEMEIKDIILNEKDITIATYAKEGEVEVKIIAKGQSKDFIEERLNKVIEKVENKVGTYIYGFDNTTIEETVFKLLKEKGYKVGFCESCTGGLISSRFIRIPGASEVLDRTIVTYSNKSKIEELGVKKETLEQYGAVSKETALEMAEGLLKKGDLDLVLSTTGIAGPAGGSEEKPVGLVYIGIATKTKNKVLKCNFNGDRESIQNRTTTRSFAEIRNLLLN